MTAKPRAEVGSTTVYYITAQGGKKETEFFTQFHENIDVNTEDIGVSVC